MLGTAPDQPAVRHLYEIIIKADSSIQFNCLTCNTKNGDKVKCSYNEVAFSSNFTYYAHDCLGLGIPRSVIRETAVSDISKVTFIKSQLFFVS